MHFGQFLWPSSGVFHCTHSNGICHVQFYSKHKFEKLVHLVGFNIRIDIRRMILKFL